MEEEYIKIKKSKLRIITAFIIGFTTGLILMNLIMDC